jgi:hypothetical protein
MTSPEIYRNVSWATRTTGAVFEWQVYTHDYQIPVTSIKKGVCATRAQATGHAKKWCLYYRRISAKLYSR